MLRRALLVVALAPALSCNREASRPPVQAAPLPAAPWSGAELAVSEVQPVYLTVWNAAENGGRCALVAPAPTSAAVADGVPRAATFAGGWAVAYDGGGTRGASGVAGTGAGAWSADVYDEWPHRRIFADSSRVGYGPEGGTGPNWLAYVRIPGQQCLYNVWSRRGREHLESLLAGLRWVDAPDGDSARAPSPRP